MVEARPAHLFPCSNRDERKQKKMMNDALTPRAIVSALDEHIIGQQEAKRAVAVALRNRWRRQRLPDALRDEVTPKKILMIGPTGCGTTDIARRLAKLADAPFVQVETTKFTEVGYFRRSVDQNITYLYDGRGSSGDREVLVFKATGVKD